MEQSLSVCRYRCPVCRTALYETGKTYTCENRHTFDVSAEGYVNLAAVKKNVSELSGDAADTCRARRRFLETGHYKPLADAFCELAEAYGAVSDVAFVIDAGCGEGYYARQIKARYPGIDLYGIDLAKQGIKLAAKYQKHAERKNHYAVAGIFDMPFEDSSAAAVVSVFAPVADAECRRVLAPGGVLLVAGPGKNHLFGLKSALYDTPEENDEKIPEYEGFTLAETRRVTYSMQLDGQSAADLFAMTPYFWRSSADVREKSETLENVATDADFLIKVYVKNRT